MKFFSALLVTLAFFPTPSHAAGGKIFQRIIIVVLENTDYENALGQPFLSSLAIRGALLTNFHGETHPSQPNYIALVGGSTLGVRTNQNANLNEKHLGDLLEEKNLDWRGYAEHYPENCFLGAMKDGYTRKHMPFLSFTNVQKSPNRCSKVLNAKRFDSDAAAGTLPDLSLYIPDLKNSGHDTGIAFADRWLKEKFEKYLNDPSFMDGTLFVLTFDESASDSVGDANHILTLLIGPMIRAGSKTNEHQDHYSLLRLIEENWNLGNLGRNDLNATPIRGVFQNP